MEKINAMVKKWGNSFGVIIPKEIVEKGRLENKNIEITLSYDNTMTVSKLVDFSRKQNLPKSNKKIQEIIEEIDEELWSED